MSKSTPITQIPYPPPTGGHAPSAQVALGGGGGIGMGVMGGGGGASPPPFVNDQHRQLVTQAQNAAQNYPMPQPSTNPRDIASTEDDATIQETLQYINGPASGSGGGGVAGAVAMGAGVVNAAGGGGFDPYAAAALYDPQPAASPSAFASLLKPSPEDVYLVVIGVVAFVLLTVFPVHRIVYKYVSIDHIPYSELLVKASLMGAALFFGRRIVTPLSN